MKSVIHWSIDKILGVGILLALYLSIVLGGDVNFQTTIASGLIGYIGRSMQEDIRKDDVYGRDCKH